MGRKNNRKSQPIRSLPKITQLLNTKETPKMDEMRNNKNGKRGPLVEPGTITTMRSSNPKYVKGAIVRAKFVAGSEFSYLHHRPMVVISEPIGFFSSLVCCTMGSRNCPGIIVSLTDRLRGGYVGGNAESVIYPWSIVTIKVSQVIETLGYLDPNIMRALDAAIDFHRGLNPNPPGYISDRAYEQYYGVTYSTGEFTDDFFDHLVGKTPTAEPEEPAHEIDNSSAEEKQHTSDNTEVHPHPDCHSGKYSVVEYKGKKRFIDEVFLETYLREHPTVKKCINKMDEDMIGNILCRAFPLCDISTKLNISIPTAKNVRTYLMYEYGTKTATRRINSKTRGKIENLRFLDPMDRIALCAYVDLNDIQIPQKELLPVLAQWRKVFGINPKNKTWSDLVY